MRIKTILLLIILMGIAVSCVQAEGEVVLDLAVVDAVSGDRIPARVLVRGDGDTDYVPDGGLVVPINADKWFVCEGAVKLKVQAGGVVVRAERGTEYRPVIKHMTLAADKSYTIKMQRWVDMKKLGYVSGENHVHLGIEDAGKMAAAEGLDFATVLSWWHSPKIKFPHGSQWVREIKSGSITVPTAVFCGEKEDNWGAIYATGLRSAVEFEGGSKRANLEFIRKARRDNGLICYQGGWSREVLIDALAGIVDVVNVCNNNFHRHKFQPRKNYSNLLDVEGLPEYPDTPEGMMKMNTDTYYRLLNCGLKLAAGAGSAIGAKSTPIGYNRAYVRAGDDPTMEQFLKAWGQGKNFVTNGPMLFLKTSGNNMPGDTIDLSGCGEKITFEVEAITEQPLRSLEIIANGKVIAAAKLGSCENKAKVSCTVDIKEGTWVAGRCTEEDLLLSDEKLDKYRSGSGLFKREPCRLRFAHTSPIYITVNGKGAKVDKSVKEADKMLAAFRKFAKSEASEKYLGEILDVIPAGLE